VEDEHARLEEREREVRHMLDSHYLDLVDMAGIEQMEDAAALRAVLLRLLRDLRDLQRSGEEGEGERERAVEQVFEKEEELKVWRDRVEALEHSIAVGCKAVREGVDAARRAWTTAGVRKGLDKVWRAQEGLVDKSGGES